MGAGGAVWHTSNIATNPLQFNVDTQAQHDEYRNL
jgi:hypothetical protein